MCCYGEYFVSCTIVSISVEAHKEFITSELKVRLVAEPPEKVI